MGNSLDERQRRPAPVAVVIAGLVLGGIATLLLYRQSPGVGFLLTIGCAVSVLIGLGLAAGSRPSVANLWLPAFILFCAAMVAARANMVLLLMNGLAIIGLGGLWLASYAGEPVLRWTVGGYLAAQIRTWVSLVFRPVAVLVAAGKATGRSQASRAVWPVARGLVIAVPLLCVFTALFVSADRVFASYVGDLFGQVGLRDLISQAVLVAVFGWLATGALDLALGPGERSPLRALFGEREAPAASAPRLGFIEATIAVALIDLLFLAFVAIQLQYLFLGPESLALRGGVVSHAQYAREGFFQLLVAAFLTFGVIWGLATTTRRERSVERLAFNVLATVMVACAVVMLVSAFRRLYLYELEYGFTQDRLFAHAVTVWLGVVFIAFLVALWTRRARIFSVGLLIACLGFVVGLNALDPDAFNAARNIERHTLHGRPLDVSYLGRISTDAVPTLVALVDSLPAAAQAELLGVLQRKHAQLAREARDWRSANLSVILAQQALDSRFGPRSRDEPAAVPRGSIP